MVMESINSKFLRKNVLYIELIHHAKIKIYLIDLIFNTVN